MPLERGTIDIYDISARRRLARLSVDGGPVLAAAFSRDGSLLIAGSDDGRLRLFSTDGWRPLSAAFQAHTGFISTVDVSPDGRRFVTAASDGQVRLWDRATVRPIGAPLPGPRRGQRRRVLLAGRCLRLRGLRQRTRLQMGRPAGRLGTTRLRGRGPPPHPGGVGCGAPRAPVRAGVLRPTGDRAERP